MFEVGKSYYVTTWEPGEDGGSISSVGMKVLKVEFPLVKFQSSSGGSAEITIVNVGSNCFVRAEELDYDATAPVRFVIETGET